MMELIKKWAIDIVVVTIFVTFLEIIMPNNSMRRYIRLIVGLLIIIVIVSPFIKMLSKDINIDKEVFANIAKEDNYISEGENEFIESQKSQVIEIYRENIKRDLGTLIKDKTQYYIKESSISISEDTNSNNLGEIESIYILLGDEQVTNKDSNSSISVDKVNKISIDVQNEKNSEISNNSIFEDIEAEIVEFFKLSRDSIEINIEHEKMRRN